MYCTITIAQEYDLAEQQVNSLQTASILPAYLQGFIPSITKDSQYYSYTKNMKSQK